MHPCQATSGTRPGVARRHPEAALALTEEQLRRREAELVRRSERLRNREQDVAAREAELTGCRPWRALAARLAFVPSQGARVVGGLWLLAGATSLGGVVLTASAVVCGLLLVTSALIQLAGANQPPPGAEGSRRG